MNILLKKDIYGEFEEIIVPDDTTAEHVFFRCRETLPYTVLAAKIDNICSPLNSKIKQGSKVEFLDMRNRHASLIYQHSLVLLYAKAVWDVTDGADVEIKNSLNQGLYTEIKGAGDITDELLQSVEKRMREITELDMPINAVSIDAGDTLEFFDRHGMTEKKERLQKASKTRKIVMCELDGYMDFLYDIVVPSTGYLDMFELRRYRRGVLLRFPQPQEPDKMPEYNDQKFLYNAFAETDIWQERLGIKYVRDLNEKIKDGSMREVVQLSEALHDKKIIEIAKDIKDRGKRIILIAGPSSSGKTTFAKRLCIQLKVEGISPLYMGTDDYFLERDETPLDENGERNYEDLEAIDIELFNSDMNSLLSGEETDLPKFDFIEGKKVFGKRITKIGKKTPIVIEGIHGLNDILTEKIADEEKFKIYISPLTGLNIDNHNCIPTTDNRMLRRMVRDNLYRGKSAADTIKEWPGVMRGERKNIFPYGDRADAFFNSVYIYEMSLLKKYATPLLEAVSCDDAGYSEAKRLLGFLEFFDEFTEDELIANNAIVREFIGGSVFAE